MGRLNRPLMGNFVPFRMRRLHIDGGWSRWDGDHTTTYGSKRCDGHCGANQRHGQTVGLCIFHFLFVKYIQN